MLRLRRALGRHPRDTARGNGTMFAVVRLCVVPLAIAATVAAGDDLLRDPVYLALALVAQLYAVALWLLVRRGRAPSGRFVQWVDVLVVVLLVAVADAHETGAGRVPLLLLFFAWGVALTPRQMLQRGLSVTAVVVAIEVLRHGEGDALRVGIFAIILLCVTTLVADQASARMERLAALERRSEELDADVQELERRERARIAQLLHDDALQRLLAARQDLEDAREDEDAMRRVGEGLAEATSALRSLTLVVNDEHLEAAGFAGAVGRIAQDAAARSGLVLELHVDPELGGELSPVLLPIVRELVANVERHARARTLEVTVRGGPSTVTLTVADDGVGIGAGRLVEAAREGQLGHLGVRSRVEDLAGVLDVESVVGNGTRVTVRVQLAAVERRRALDRTLRHEREWNAALLAGLPDPFVVITDDLRVVEVSDRFLSVTGWSRAQLLAAPAGQLPYLPASRRERLAERMRAREPWVDYQLIEELQCRDGRRIAGIISVRWVRDPRNGRTLRLTAFKDIADRIAAERELKAERDLSNAIRRVLQEPYVQTRDGVVVEVNAAFCQLTGFTEEQLVGARKPYFFIRTATLDEALAHGLRMDTGEVSRAELQILRADGTEIRVEVLGLAVRDEDGVTIGRVVTAMPVGPVPPLGPLVPGLAVDPD